MSSAEGTHECEECETSYASKEELDKHNEEGHPEEWLPTPTQLKGIQVAVTQGVLNYFNFIMGQSRREIGFNQIVLLMNKKNINLFNENYCL